MTLDPILAAPLTIQLHLAAALVAVAVTPLLLIRRKGTHAHKAWGRVWVGAMALTAFSSFWISEIRLWGPWSPIHILSAVTLVGLVQAVRFARVGDIRGHKAALLGSVMGLLGAGLFTLLPGRTLSEVFLTGHENLGFGLILVLGGLGLWGLARRWRML